MENTDDLFEYMKEFFVLRTKKDENLDRIPVPLTMVTAGALLLSGGIVSSNLEMFWAGAVSTIGGFAGIALISCQDREYDDELSNLKAEYGKEF